MVMGHIDCVMREYSSMRDAAAENGILSAIEKTMKKNYGSCIVCHTDLDVGVAGGGSVLDKMKGCDCHEK